MNSLIFGGSERGNKVDLFYHRIHLIFSSPELQKRLLNHFQSTQAPIPCGLQEELRYLLESLKIVCETEDEYKKANEELQSFSRQAQYHFSLFRPELRPNPESGYWPDPSLALRRDIYSMLPFAVSHSFLDRQTRIVSLGSCFASEIAKELQGARFNYLVTESPHDEKAGVLSRDYDSKNQRAPFSAAWGLIFNTPSFKQLAEKAFRVTELPRILVKHENESQYKDFYFDPFRENMLFASKEAYDRNYELHRQAVRKAFEEAEVIILTFGLNECWEFIADGKVAAMPPKTLEMASIMRPKILSVEENIQNMQTFIDLVRKHNSQVKFIISVSPVPFASTVRLDRHVIEANTHSKSVLRVVAEELVSRNLDVYYLPSYETVTRCVRRPWESDERHVRRAAVRQVMRLFNAMFVKPEARVFYSDEPSPEVS